ncbi:hypothetical protein M413DRAFT_423195 [Hebeloma cylindrosporum]|uniref:Uncharacterized protein n=1 Tax=Hebeloma cylindrosporum TaxID=76867 RepID=A0A0C2Y8P6_HEBCY|nr:hypothetical protein M413DRAFT_423195 [Hebeloma cylindrosporum h7]
MFLLRKIRHSPKLGKKEDTPENNHNNTESSGQENSVEQPRTQGSPQAMGRIDDPPVAVSAEPESSSAAPLEEPCEGGRTLEHQSQHLNIRSSFNSKSFPSIHHHGTTGPVTLMPYSPPKPSSYKIHIHNRTLRKDNGQKAKKVESDVTAR